MVKAKPIGNEKEIELPRLSLEGKWEVARGNIIYFVVSGITFAKSRGRSPEEFGADAGNVAVPYWRKGLGEVGEALSYFVKGLCENYQQFKGFEIEILRQSATSVEARMKNFGEDGIREWKGSDVTVDEYLRFFEKKWEAIANSLRLIYKQTNRDDWTYFTVTRR